MYGYEFLDRAMKYAHPVKQAVISPSALFSCIRWRIFRATPGRSLSGIYWGEHEREIRGCLARGAHKVQIDFTEGRLAIKVDPSGWLLNGFIDLNNLALSRFPKQECRPFSLRSKGAGSSNCRIISGAAPPHSKETLRLFH